MPESIYPIAVDRTSLTDSFMLNLCLAVRICLKLHFGLCLKMTTCVLQLKFVETIS